jgi:Homing endonuclease associated repeat
VTKEEIISALNECAARLGHAPSLSEIRVHSGITLRAVKKHFVSYTSALTEAGLERCGGGTRLTLHALFKEWAEVARKLKKIPTMAEFELHGKYSTIPYVSRFVSWKYAPRGLHRFAEKEGLAAEYADVLAIIKEQYDVAEEWLHSLPAGATSTSPSMAPPTAPAMTPTTRIGDSPLGEMLSIRRPMFRPGTRPSMRRPIMVDRPVYGAPMMYAPLAHIPINEMGVVYLFGAMAWDLGFMVMRIQREFPDCEAMREMDVDQWQRVWIEFEWESRNFLEHQHDPEKCDLIVCWRHNWPECPLEVVELSNLMREMGTMMQGRR